MQPAEILGWFDVVGARKIKERLNGNALSSESVQWITEAGAAIHAAFPVAHYVRQQWDGALARERGGFGEWMTLEACEGIFRAAHGLVRDGRLGSFVDAIRVHAEDDLLEQADQLLVSSHRVAAAVLAGGVLEVHLRRLCEKHRLPIAGVGSIDKYNGAIGQARNEGTTIYEKADTSQVTSWGQIRNEAAHRPDQFNRTIDEIRLMLAGVRGFVARIS
jgi:hypothetical protein